MEEAFNHAHGAWLFQMALGGGGGGGGGGSRNQREPRDSDDLAALAGRCEKRALEALGYRFELDGRPLAAGNGLLDSGYLSTRALRECLGLEYPETYKSLWGRDGRVAQRAQVSDGGRLAGLRALLSLAS